MCKKLNKELLKKIIKSNYMLIAITIGIIIGFLVGLALKLSSYTSDDELSLWFKLPGRVFIRSLQLLILPVIFFGVITATSSFNIKSNARMSVACLLIAVLSIVFASLIGVLGSLSFKLILVQTDDISNENNSTKPIDMDRSVYDIVADFLRNLIPNNIFKATMYQELTQYSTINGVKKKQIIDLPNTNLLGILLFAIVIGIAAGVIQEKGESFCILIKSINEVFITILRWMIKFAPYGIASLIIDAVIEIKDFKQTFKEVWIFAAIVIACCLFYSFCFQAFLLFLITKTNPFNYFPKYVEPVILAFASTSSAVCMSRSMEICEQKVNVSPTVSRFGIPFFTTLKPDGSVIFITVATVFLATVNNYSLSFSDYILIVVMYNFPLNTTW